MIENTRAIELIEEAQQGTQLCPVCGQPAVPVARPGGVWLVCASLVEPKGILRRLLSLDIAAGHTNRLIFETPALEAAA
jgi:hypothetical protein